MKVRSSACYCCERVAHVELDPDALSELEGSYTFVEAGFSIDIAVKEGHLELATPSGTLYELHAISDDELIIVETGERIYVENGSRGLRLMLWGMTAIAGTMPEKQ